MSLLKPLIPISTLSDNLIVYSTGSIPILPKELNLKQTLLGGQSFRYDEHKLNIDFLIVISNIYLIDGLNKAQINLLVFLVRILFVYNIKMIIFVIHFL